VNLMRRFDHKNVKVEPDYHPRILAREGWRKMKLNLRNALSS
jgi:hypothetical protein